MTDKIKIEHGAGGAMTKKLMENLFLRLLHNPELGEMDDSSSVEISGVKAAFTTDNYIVRPLFFNGGDIGKIAVCGTVNDLAMSGAEPRFLSAGFIVEEGFSEEELSGIVKSMSNTAFECGVKVVCSDLKVVESGKGDGIYINTSGIGEYTSNYSPVEMEEGDSIILSGTIGEHELAIITSREGYKVKEQIKSDAASLNSLVRSLLSKSSGIKRMKDPTRGGVVTALYKWISTSNYGIIIDKEKVPVMPAAKHICELLGLDPLYMANMGKMLMICRREKTEEILTVLKAHPLGENAALIGTVSSECRGMLIERNKRGEEKIKELKSGSQQSRIC